MLAGFPQPAILVVGLLDCHVVEIMLALLQSVYHVMSNVFAGSVEAVLPPMVALQF